jgi:hypothetical protein
LQSDWSNNDNDWKLKKLQHDSLKTAEKVVESMRETIEKEVLAQSKEYERLFGSCSAQFAEYLTMVAQKLEQHGVQHSDVINWLNSAAREGTVPRDYANDLRDSQSKTVPFIDGGPMHDFGEQSLLDKSMGTQGAGSARPSGSMAQPAPFDLAIAQAVTSPYPTYGSHLGTDTGNGHGNAGNGSNPIQARPVSAPPHTPVSMPLQQAMPVPQPMAMSQAMPMQQAIAMPVQHSMSVPVPHPMPFQQQASVPMPQPTPFQQQASVPMPQPTPFQQQASVPMPQPTPFQQQASVPMPQPTPFQQQASVPMPQPTPFQQQASVPMPQPTPFQQPASVPMPQPTPFQQQASTPMPQPMPFQQQAPAPMPQPFQHSNLPPHSPTPPNQAQPQPNFNQAPTYAQPAPPPPPPPPRPPPQLPQPGNQFSPVQAAMPEDKKEDDKFDPFTAWD